MSSEFADRTVASTLLFGSPAAVRSSARDAEATSGEATTSERTRRGPDGGEGGGEGDESKQHDVVGHAGLLDGDIEPGSWLDDREQPKYRRHSAQAKAMSELIDKALKKAWPIRLAQRKR